MGIFSKLFGVSRNPEQLPSSQSDSAPCKTQTELLERFGGIAMEKQLHFGEIIGGNRWNVDMTAGTITFGEGQVYSLQAIGTFSHGAQTWLWSWANAKSGLSEEITRNARMLKAYGEKNGINLLQNDSFPFSKNDMHMIGMIASGFTNSSGYYIADYGQGAMLLTINSDSIDSIRDDSHLRVMTVFPQLISLYEMNHKPALISYLRAKRYDVTDVGSKISGVRGFDKVTAEFDAQGRMTSLKG